MGSHHVLMIDDDESLVGIMAIKLTHLGYKVDTAVQSAEGFAMASKHPYDLLILDIKMPGMDGIEICRNLRSQGILTPILMLSGKTDKPDIVKSLDIGADDYLTKPFSQTELVARMRALVRRNRKTFPARWVRVCGVELDIPNSTVINNGKSVMLTNKEASLLRRLMDESPDTVSREQLLKDVWGIDDMHTSNRLDVYVRRLRFKLEGIGADHFIRTLRGSGYYFGPLEKDS